MNKTEAEHLVFNTFTHAFSKEKFTQFMRNLLPDLQLASTKTISNAQLPQGFRENVHSYTRLGTYRDPNGDVLDVVIVKLKQQGSLDHARTRQRNLMTHYLNKRSKDAVLAAYTTDDPTDWRFSFVKLAYQTEITNKGTVKVKKDFTPARRYSFLVGEHEPNHTAQKQLSVLLMSEGRLTIGQIEEAFNIESVTKEFFEDYRSLFLQIKENMDQIETSNQKIKDEFERCEIDTANFAKKLLGQIVFLYFLQKKGWLGVPKDQAWGTGDKKFLSNLFIKNKNRNFFDDVLEPFFYEALAIERKGDYYSDLECKVPFLNGGLFEPLHGYDWENIGIGLSNQIFENVFRIFDRYNFTVREDEPLEKEVAVDPEMLGKVFENLLDIKDRKSKGAFYTPREIVHYMCQESLINYLDITLNKYEKKVDKGDIEIFIREGDLSIERDQAREERKLEDNDYGLPESIRKHAEEIDFALADIKICDPAVGSGAFLVGMMTEIIQARNILISYLHNQCNRDAYTFKWHCIENSLYGVDIDVSAVEIAKLRLWLSLVVDEESYDQIRPLPNLDYRIICGNSLLSVQKDLFNYTFYPELEKKKIQYFDTTSPKNKKVIRHEIENLINQLTEGKQLFDFELYFSEIFSAKQGFDIVIGNPPYVFSRENLSSDQKELFKELFTLTQFKLNLYILYIEKSYCILNNFGTFSFIIPNNWLTLSTTSNLRHFILTKTFNTKLVLNYDHVFQSASVDTCLLFFNKTGENSLSSYTWSKQGISLLSTQSSKVFLENNGYIISNLESESFIHRDILKKINRLSSQLGKVCEIKNGVQAYTVGEGKPVQTEEIKNNRVYHSKTKHDQSWIKYLDGVDIGRYKYSWSGQYIKYGMNLSRPRQPYLFVDERLFVRQIPASPPYSILACYITERAVVDNNSIVVCNPKEGINIKYVLALLNSQLVSYWFIHTFGKLQRKTFPQFKVKELRQFPILEIDDDKQFLFIELVEKLNLQMQNFTNHKLDHDPIEKINKKIDQLVYQIYGLTEKEIAIIEENMGR